MHMHVSGQVSPFSTGLYNLLAGNSCSDRISTPLRPGPRADNAKGKVVRQSQASSKAQPKRHSWPIFPTRKTQFFASFACISAGIIRQKP